MERGESRSRAKGEVEMCVPEEDGGSGEIKISFSLFSPPASAVLYSVPVPSLLAPL